MSEEFKPNENEIETEKAVDVTPENMGSGEFNAPLAQSKKSNICGVCGNIVAKNAKKCPACGAKNKRPFYKMKRFWIVAIVGIIILVNFLSGMKKPESVVKAEDLIDAIGKVSIDSGDAIIEAEKAVSSLTDEELKRVGKIDKLEKAREKFDELTLDQNVAELQDKIDKIGTVTLDSNDLIKEARSEYDKSSDEIKNRINNYNVLEAAEKRYDELEIENVIALITAIGEVNQNSAEKVEAAKDAYSDLDSDQKKKVTNANVLTDAEKALETLKKEKVKTLLGKLRAKPDEITGNTFYYPMAWPFYTEYWAADVRSFVLPYIGTQGDKIWFRLIFHYTGDDWVFFDNVTIVTDNNRYYETFNYFDVDREYDSGEVWETADILISDSDVEMLRDMANSSKVLVRFSGDSHRHDIEISAKDKQAIKEILDVYDAVN